MKISRKNVIQKDGGFSVRILANEPVNVNIYALSNTKHLYRLLPKVCGRNDFNSSRVKAFVPFIAPMNENKEHSVYQLSEEFQPNRIYVVSNPSDEGSDSLMHTIGAISKRCDDAGIADPGLNSNFESILKRN